MKVPFMKRSERFRSEGSIHETLGSERFRSQGSIPETLGSVRFRSQGSIHETLAHFSKYGMCLHITCFVFHIACFLFHIACFLLLIICQSEKQFLSTSCWDFHMGLLLLGGAESFIFSQALGKTTSQLIFLERPSTTN